MTTLTEAELDELERLETADCLDLRKWSRPDVFADYTDMLPQLIALARQALAARSSDHIPDAGKMVWEPIETAPKDGTRILWCADNGEFTRQRWSYSVIRWPEYEECFEDGWWLPLPPSPNSERIDDDAATRQQIDVDRGSERRSNEGLHPGDTGGSDTVAVSTGVRPVAPAPSEGKDDGLGLIGQNADWATDRGDDRGRLRGAVCGDGVLSSVAPAPAESGEQGHIVVCNNCGHQFDATNGCATECWCKPENYPSPPDLEGAIERPVVPDVSRREGLKSEPSGHGTEPIEPGPVFPNGSEPHSPPERESEMKMKEASNGR